MRFDKIEVHFKTKDGKARRVIISPDGDVKSIHLDQPIPPNAKPPTNVKGLEIIGDAQLGDGPMVCYQVSGEQVCW